ncbi:MAG: thiamine-phosphate kinase [Acidobacteriota bacterium]
MTVGRLGEERVIQHIAARFSAGGPAPAHLRVGIGDDAAVLIPPPEQAIVLSSDCMVEGVHFRREWTPARDLGHKALAVNLSDLAAMGAVPDVFLLDLGLPADWPVSELDSFLDGMANLAARTGMVLAGGDTYRSVVLQMSLTAVGRVDPGRFLSRKGARPGDQVAVTGCLGSAAAGLALLEREWRLGQDGRISGPARGEGPPLPEDVVRHVLVAHLAPEPQLEAGKRLSGVARAGIDLSDGLAADLAHLCAASDCGAVVDRRRVPVDEPTRQVFTALRRDPVDAALTGGEDYQLLVAMPPGANLDGLTVIGGFSEPRGGIRLSGPEGERGWPGAAYRHFETA